MKKSKEYFNGIKVSVNLKNEIIDNLTGGLYCNTIDGTWLSKDEHIINISHQELDESDFETKEELFDYYVEVKTIVTED